MVYHVLIVGRQVAGDGEDGEDGVQCAHSSTGSEITMLSQVG